MQNYNYYRLEIPCSANSKKFSVLEVTSIALKIIALLCLIVLFRYFYIAIIIWGISIAVNFFKRNLVYKYVYTVSDGKLTVEKEYNYEKKIRCEEVDLKKARITRNEVQKKYYETSQEIPLSIIYEEKAFSIDVDEYFYALVNFYNDNGEKE